MGSLDIPEQFNLMGVFSLARQVIGLGWDFLKKTAARIIGEENVERLEWVIEQLKTLIEGGWQALFDKIKDSLSGLKEELFAKIQEYLVVSVIKKAIVKIASLFSPVGAVVQLVLTVWDVFQALKDQFAQIMDVVTSVVDALDLIVQGTLGPAKEKVEQVLAGVLPVAIGLLANLIGLGGLGKTVEEFIESIRERIEKAVVKLIKKLKKKLESLFSRRGKRGDADAEHGETAPEDEKKHKRYAQAAKEALEEPPDEAIAFDAFRRQKREQADRLEQTYDRKLERPVRMTIEFTESASKDAQDNAVDFEVRVAPNTVKTSSKALLTNVIGSPDSRLTLFRERSDFAPTSLAEGKEVFIHPDEDTNVTFSETSRKPWKQPHYLEFFKDEQKLELSVSHWNTDKKKALKRSDWFHVGSKNSQRYAHADDAPESLDYLGFIGEKESASDAEKIAVYDEVLVSAKVDDGQWPDPSIGADQYRREMRALVVAAYKGPTKLAALDKNVLSAKVVPSHYNRVIGQIFEEWVAENYGVTRDPVPVISSGLLDQEVIADGYEGTTIVEVKAISTPREPNTSERQQMERYGDVLRNEIEWLRATGGELKSVIFDSIRYQFNNEAVAEEWLSAIQELIDKAAKRVAERVTTEGT